MSREKLWILSISLSLVLIGLIVVQLKWIDNAFDLKNKQFQQLVNNTLSDVSRQLEQYYTSERMQAILDQVVYEEEEPELSFSFKEGDAPVIHLEDEKKEVLHLNDEMTETEYIEIIGDTLLVISNKDKKPDTILIDHFKEDESINKLESSIEEQKLLVTTVMKKMLLEDVSFEEKVEQKHLEKVLFKNLYNTGIDLDFEYSVIKNNKTEIYNSDGFSKKTDCYYFRTSLMSDKLLEEDTYLYLYFPGQKRLLRGSLGVLGPLTVGLSLLMIFLFVIAMYVIFKQKRLSDVKNDFVNNMTHELKTPISTISLASQMLSDDSIPSEQKNIANISKIIQTESKRLGYQVERVLQMAVLDQGHLVLKRTELGMKEIVETVLQNFKIQVASRNGTIEVIEDSNQDFVFGDRVHLTNVLTNLLDNAVKYSKEQPEITVTLYNTSSYFGLSVKDNGIGISKENQKRVFDRFYRVSTGNVHDVKGFGLGLSYVKLIIEQHEGRVSLNSEAGKGTTFEIQLPLHNTEKN